MHLRRRTATVPPRPRTSQAVRERLAYLAFMRGKITADQYRNVLRGKHA